MSPPRPTRWFLSCPDLQRPPSVLNPHVLPLCPPHLHLPAPLHRPHCLWRVIDFLPAPEKRAASARLEVTHFPGAFSSLLIKRSPGSPHSLRIHSAIRATPPLRTPSMGGRAGSVGRGAKADFSPSHFVPPPLLSSPLLSSW